MTAEMRFGCELCDARPDGETRRVLRAQLREALPGMYLDARPGRWLIWTGGGLLGPARYACPRHRGDLTARLRAQYGSLGRAVWESEPHPQRWPDRVSAAAATELAPCVSGSAADLQLAIAAEFGRADAVATHGLLDDLARPLFGLASRPAETQAEALLALVADDLGFEARGGGGPPDLLLPCVLRTRVAHPLMLAIVASELARRAGIAVTVCSSSTRWYVGVPGDEQMLLLDTDLGDGGRPPEKVLAHCRHELAYCTLTGLSRSFAGRGRLQAARRATRMKLALPLADELRADACRELDALDGAARRREGGSP